MKERLQKILAARGVTSRRNAEQMILNGRVMCNGRICTLGESADPECDTILIDGKPIPDKTNNVYIMLNKPRGYVTTLSDEKGRKNVALLVEGCKTRVYPVGRLDMDTEGLLLLTNDGDFANKLMHPSHEVRKTYLVTVENATSETIERVKRPIILDGYQIRRPEVDVVRIGDNGQPSLIQITIHEGRNRQVRRMCANAGLTVLHLRRISEGALTLGDLAIGKWRYLTSEEVASFRD